MTLIPSSIAKPSRSNAKPETLTESDVRRRRTISQSAVQSSSSDTVAPTMDILTIPFPVLNGPAAASPKIKHRRKSLLVPIRIGTCPCACKEHFRWELLTVTLPLRPITVFLSLFGEDADAINMCGAGMTWQQKTSAHLFKDSEEQNRNNEKLGSSLGSNSQSDNILRWKKREISYNLIWKPTMSKLLFSHSSLMF